MSQVSTAPIVQPQQSVMPQVSLNALGETDGQTYLKVLIISGESHVFSFDPDMTVGRAKELIWNMWPSGEYFTLWIPSAGGSALLEA